MYNLMDHPVQMFREPELETDGNATRAVKRLYASCMDVGEYCNW